MKLHLVEQIIDQFLTMQLNAEATEWYYPHSLVRHFHQNWRITDPGEFSSMYDLCLKSEYSQRWWKKEKYMPKEIMMHLIEADPELAVIAWKDLANEKGLLDGRISRFGYYCDELLNLYRKQNFKSVDTYHHQDASILSLYLAGMYPEKYSLYPGLEIFRAFCRAVGSPDIPLVDDLSRYAKVSSIGFTFLQRNNKFIQLCEIRNSEHPAVKLIPFQLSYELISFGGASYK